MSFFGFILLLFISYFSVCSCKEAEVFCPVGNDCVLPCTFQAGSYISIHWKKSPEDARVHSYFKYRDQLQLQHQNFTDRASLLGKKEINEGTASLLLKKVTVHDNGRYVCFTSTSTDSKISSVNLKVFVRSFEVDVVVQDSELLCRSEGVYPEPSVSWDTRLLLPEPEVRTTVRQREDQLYDIYSSVSPPTTPTVYSCNVSTAHYWRSTAVTDEYPVAVFYRDAVLRCPVPNAPTGNPTSKCIWNFNHTQTIVTRTGSELVFNESWRPFVDALTDSNSLVLMDLTFEQEGPYSCHINTAHQTFVTIIHLEIQLKQLFDQMSEDAAVELEVMTVWMICALFLLGISFCCFRKKGSNESKMKEK